MPVDKVTIDPEFRHSGHRPAHDGGGAGWLALVGLAVAVTALGWLLAAVDGATPPTDPDLEALTTLPPTASSTRSSVAPLREAVPGFTDTITAVTWDDAGVDVLRWPASESAPATMLALEHADGGRNRAVDASGRWFVEIRGASVLDVYVLSDGNPRSPEPRRVSSVLAGARTWSAAWHDTRPGRLGWLACPEDASGSSGELFTVDLSDPRAEPVALTLAGFPCEDRGLRLARWGDWGVLLHASEPSGIVQVLLDGDGRQLSAARLGPVGEWFVGVGPENTTVWTEGLSRSGAASYLLTADGLERRPVPGLAQGERLESAMASPDGSLLALVPDLVAHFGSVVRLVAVDTGDVVVEIVETSSWVNRMAWSGDGRYLIYERWPDVTSNWAGVPRHVELVFHDTEAGTITALPLPGYTAALRSAG
jgi:hypothetical protein